MAGVTEFDLAFVTFHAGILQGLLELSALQFEIRALIVTDDLIPPLVQQLHVFRANFRNRLDALLGVLRQFQFRHFPGITVVVPDGKRDNQDEYDQSRYNLTTIVHHSSSTYAREL
jgi:hypothetical protein